MHLIYEKTKETLEGRDTYVYFVDFLFFFTVFLAFGAAGFAAGFAFRQSGFLRRLFFSA